MDKENIILKKSYDFALRMVNMYKYLSSKKKEFVLSKQVLRSATSIGANVEEAIGGISAAKFRAKMSIAYKEARETHYWLRLLHDVGYVEKQAFESMIYECEEISKILFSIVRSMTNKK